MVNPSTDDMVKHTHSRYTLVVLASKRARQLLAGNPCHVENPSNKFVTAAMEEIVENKITYSMNGETADE
jgi:DNA-directed RNA polymerase subunit omega